MRTTQKGLLDESNDLLGRFDYHCGSDLGAFERVVSGDAFRASLVSCYRNVCDFASHSWCLDRGGAPLETGEGIEGPEPNKLGVLVRKSFLVLVERLFS